MTKQAQDVANSHTPTVEVSDGARAFYDELCQLAQRDQASSSIHGTQPTHSTVLSSVTAKNLSRDVHRAYSLVIQYLRELEQAGWITRQQRRHQPSQIQLVNPQSSEFKVQSSEFRVQSSAMHSFPLSTNKSKYMHAAAEMNFELSGNELSENANASDAPAMVVNTEQIALTFEVAADFHKRLLGLLAEFNINGRRREQLAQAIIKLVENHFDPARIDKVLADVRAGLEHAKKKQEVGQADNAATVGAAILEDYIATGGQLVLFPIQQPKPQGAPQTATPAQAKGARGNGRTYQRQQVVYTDEMRAAAREKAKAQLAARKARTEQQAAS